MRNGPNDLALLLARVDVVLREQLTPPGRLDRRYHTYLEARYLALLVDLMSAYAIHKLSSLQQQGFDHQAGKPFLLDTEISAFSRVASCENASTVMQEDWEECWRAILRVCNLPSVWYFDNPKLASEWNSAVPPARLRGRHGRFHSQR